MKRRRHALYLSEPLSDRLELMAETQHLAKSEILERALAQLLTPDAQGASAACVLRHDRMARAIDRLERDLAITTELVALLLRYFLVITPPLPASEREAARALGRKRFDVVVTEIGRILKTDKRFAKRVMSAMAEPERPDGDPEQKATREDAPTSPTTAGAASNPSVSTPTRESPNG